MPVVERGFQKKEEVHRTQISTRENRIPDYFGVQRSSKK